jgi:hypothetical protein
MSTKNIIISLIGVILIGGSVYFSMSKKQAVQPVQTPPVTTTNTENTASQSVVVEPTQNASTDEIIDYIVDGQTKEESQAAQATLK